MKKTITAAAGSILLLLSSGVMAMSQQKQQCISDFNAVAKESGIATGINQKNLDSQIVYINGKCNLKCNSEPEYDAHTGKNPNTTYNKHNLASSEKPIGDEESNKPPFSWGINYLDGAIEKHVKLSHLLPHKSDGGLLQGHESTHQGNNGVKLSDLSPSLTLYGLLCDQELSN